MGFLPNPLADTGDQPTVDDGTPSPSDIEADAREPATVAYVDQRLRSHVANCPATRRLRSWSMWFAFGFGAIVVANAVAFFAGRSVIRETVREVVREELDIRGLRARVSQAPSPTAWPSLIPSAIAAGNK